MRPDHPIDELFRNALHEAEATPPPSVWEGIRVGRRPKRRLPPWFRMNGLLLLIVPLLGIGGYALLPKGDRLASEQVVLAETTEALAPPITTMRAAPATLSEKAPATIPKDVIHEETEAMSAFSMASSLGRVTATSEHAPRINTTPDEALASSDPKLLLPDPFATDMTERSMPENVITLRPLLPQLAIVRGPIPASAPPACAEYVLPHGEWNISGVVGLYDVKRDWQGEDQALVTALNGTEANNTTWGLGLELGREWRSGWGLSAGLFHERSEQQFAFTEKRSQVSQEVVTWLVTLDQQVFANEMDTVEHVHVTEARYNGTDRRHVYRIPVTGSYQRRIGPIHYAIRAGFALEYTQIHQDHSLVLDPEALLTVRSLSAHELRRRHPLLLLGTVGAGLGHSFHENWQLWLGAAYMRGLAPLGTTADAWTSPTRLGLQLRLVHQFTTKRSTCSEISVDR